MWLCRLTGLQKKNLDAGFHLQCLLWKFSKSACYSDNVLDDNNFEKLIILTKPNYSNKQFVYSTDLDVLSKWRDNAQHNIVSRNN